MNDLPYPGSGAENPLLVYFEPFAERRRASEPSALTNKNDDAAARGATGNALQCSAVQCSFVLCQLHLSACQVAAGFDIGGGGGGGGRFRSHFMKGFDLNATQPGRQARDRGAAPEGGGDSWARAATATPAAEERSCKCSSEGGEGSLAEAEAECGGGRQDT